MELAVDVGIGAVELVGEVFQVLGDVAACLVALHVIMVEVPIETGLVLVLQVGEELLLHLLQQVETDEEVAVVG